MRSIAADSDSSPDPRPGGAPRAARAWLALSDERDTWHRLAWQLWRDGWAAAERAHAGDYSAGYLDGAAARKHAQHDLVAYAAVYAARWGPGGRGHFADPRPGDFPGRGAGS